MKGFPRIKLLFICLFCVDLLKLQAQPAMIPLNGNIEERFAFALNNCKISFHNSQKPYNINQLKLLGIDSVFNQLQLPVLRDTFKGSKPNQDEQYAILEINPLFMIGEGYDKSDISKRISEYSIGAVLNVQYKSKLALNAYYLTANASYPDFIRSKIENNHVVPSQGYAFGTELGYHHKEWGGYISWSPSRYFLLDAGQGKHFWGDGYRSLFLSDVANNYPYLRMTTNVWHLQYVNLYANFKDVRNTDGKYKSFKDKFATLHYLSWNVSKRINLSFFESVVWQAKDTLNNRGYDVNYLNPVIFFRPVEYSLGSSDNSLIGLSSRVKMFKTVQIYGQWLIDEFLLSEMMNNKGWWGNKYGLQVGIKYFNPIGIKGLTLQSEVNMVRPYTYSHGSILQNYGHFGQALAHPLGANFREGILIASFIKKRWSIMNKFIYAQFGTDTAGINFGGDIYQDYTTRNGDFGHFLLQGQFNTLIDNEVRIEYMISGKMNTFAFVTYIHRKSNGMNRQISDYIFAGIKTGIFRSYYDY